MAQRITRYGLEVGLLTDPVRTDPAETVKVETVEVEPIRSEPEQLEQAESSDPELAILVRVEPPQPIRAKPAVKRGSKKEAVNRMEQGGTRHD